MDRIPTGRVLELAFDVDPMETVTRSTVATSTGEVSRRRILGVELPLEDRSFDRVVCTEGLQLLSERGRALAEMHRVLVRGGEILIAVPGAIERNSPFAELAISLERRSAVRSAAAVRWLFCMPEPDDLRGVLAAAGFEDIRIDVVRTTARPPTAETIVGRARRT